MTIVCIDCYTKSMMENSTNPETILLDQEPISQPVNSKQYKYLFLVLSGLAVICVLILLFGLSFNQRQLPVEVTSTLTPTMAVNSVSPTVNDQEIGTTDWKIYFLGDYTFKLPKTFIQQTESTSPISKLFYSSMMKNLKFHMVLKGAGLGIECVDKIQTNEISKFGKQVMIETYQGIKPGISEMCSVDSSDTFWFLARLGVNDVVALTFNEKEILFDEAKLLFDQIIATFEARKDEGGEVSEMNWKTFSNAYLSLRYPPDVNMMEKEASEIVLQKWGPTQKADTEFYDGISISFQPFELPVTAEAYAKMKIEEIERNGIGEISESLKPIQVGAYSGVTFSVAGLGNYRSVVLKAPNDMIILITDSSNDPGQLGFSQVVNQILTTVVLK